MTAPRERLDVLDGLRGFAIVLVVWYHVWLVSGQAVFGFNFIGEAGFLGVDLFFFISGFCLYYPYARAKSEGRAMPTVRRFFERRAAKIIPSYVIALGVFACVYHAQFASPLDVVKQLVLHLTFMHPLAPDTFGAISGPLWTIGIEVQFYLLFPLIVIGFARSPIAGYLLLFVVAESYRWTLGSLGLGTSFWLINQLPAFFDVFGAGMLGAYAFVSLRTRAGGVDASRATIVSLGACMCALAGLAFVSVAANVNAPDAAHDWLNGHRVLFGPACFVVAVSTFFAVPQWRSVVATRALVFLSTISYNLYLWHLEIMVWIHGSGVSPVWTVALSIPAAVGVAVLMTYLVERPLLNADLGALFRALAVRTAFARVATASPEAGTAAPSRAA